MNQNPITGIAYTVYALNNTIDQDVAQELWYGPQAHDYSYEEAHQQLTCEAMGEVQERIDNGTLDPDEFEDEVQDYVEARLDQIEIDEPEIGGVYEGVKYGISWLGGAPLLWVVDSPYTGKFKQCSPCCPGACDGDNPDPNGYEGYAVPQDWLRKE